MNIKLDNEKSEKHLKAKETDANYKIPKIFVYLPKVVTIIFAIFFFVWGIVAHVYGEKEIGIELPFIIWWLIGAGFCTILYFFLKLTFSSKALYNYLTKNIIK